MTKYVVSVPDPVAGVDWSVTVPGIYTYDVVGITAQLTTGIPSDELVDVSGNGQNGTYLSFGAFGAFGPGLLTGSRAWHTATGAGTPSYNAATVPFQLCDWTAPFTIAWWQRLDPVEVGGGWAWYEMGSPTYGAAGLIIGTASDGNPGLQPLIVAIPGGAWVAPSTVLLADGVAHHAMLSWDLVDLTLYVDGTLTPWQVITSGTLGPNPGPECYFGDPDIGAGIREEFAVFPAAHGGSEASTLYNAGLVSASAYTTEVLFLSPTAFYHMNGDTGGTGRTPLLVATDGTHDVLVIPPNTIPNPLIGPYGYAWQPGLTAGSLSFDTRTTTVAIPPLILPAGYTVGTRTLDLIGTDQWTNVVLWWDDTYQKVTGGTYDYGFPPGKFYTYRKIGV